MDDETGVDLIRRLQDEGSKNAAFREVVKLYKEKIYWHCRRMVHSHEDADDVVQNIFIKIFKGVDKFKGDSKLYTWIYRISTNECISFIEKSKKNRHFSMEQAKPTRVENEVSSLEVMEHLMNALNVLPPKQRAVFNMKYFEDMPYKIMSEVMGTSEGALKASYHHAKNKITQHILHTAIIK